MAVEVLQASGRLTETGVAFVAGMRRSLKRWSGAPVPAEELALARDVASWKQAAWRLRNVEPDPARITAWADDWIAGMPCPQARQITSLVRAGGRQAESEPLVDLAYLRLRDSERFHRLRAVPERLAEEVAEASVADALLAGGEHTAAPAAYAAAIRAAPGDVRQWAGLALALRHRPAPAVRMLVARPEVVYALHREIRTTTGTTPDPLALATWVDAAADG
jgi:hypothetical protein